MTEPSTSSELLGLTPAELGERFERLQSRLAGQWRLIESMNQREQAMVVVPSVDPAGDDLSGTALAALEERLLCLLLLLRKPRARIVYCTSQAIDPNVVDYHLGLLPGVIPAHARARLFLFPVHDGSPRPLARKLLERPRLVERIRELIPGPETTHLVPFASTHLERGLAVALGIPMFASDARHDDVSTRSGSRRLFAEVGVSHPEGIEGIRSPADAMAAILRLRAGVPGLAQARIELERGDPRRPGLKVSLSELGETEGLEAGRALAERFERAFSSTDAPSRERFWQRVAAEGAVVEAPLLLEERRLVSVECRITPVGGVEVQATHDRPVRGSSGWRFPADPAYAPAVAGDARKVAAALLRSGVLGTFSVLFGVGREPGGAWRREALQLQLGKSDAMTSYLTLKFLTDGEYLVEEASFRARGGQPKCYRTSPDVASPSYRAITPDEIFDFVVRHGLHFDHATQSGIVLHALSGLTELGSFGLTAVADSHEEALELHDRAVATLGFEADRAVGKLGPGSS